MPVKVACYVMPGHRRSVACAQAMKAGIRLAGDAPYLLHDSQHRAAEHDACVFYGFTHKLQRIAADYTAAGKPWVYIDLGYWGREGSQGSHKVVVNSRHPTAYFQRLPHDAARMPRGLQIKPWRGAGDHILLAGMGAKAADIAEHIGYEIFELGAIEQLRQFTARPIVYRPKPSCKFARPLPGTDYSPKDQPLADVFADCHAVVTHHSNVAVDALIEGIPAFAMAGVAVPMGLQDLSRIETPAYPDGREQWLKDISYTQWTWTEMTQGLPWRHLKDEGLVP